MSLVIGTLASPTEYTPFADFQRAAEVARANSLQDNVAYGIWNRDDELLAVVCDGELFVKEENWIPVVERLPENEAPMLTCGNVPVTYNRIRCAYYVPENHRWVSLNDAPPEWTVTHWIPVLRPLPSQQ